MEFITEHFSAFLIMGVTALGAVLLRISAHKYAEKGKNNIGRSRHD